MKGILINLFSEKISNEDFRYFSSGISEGFDIFNYQFPVQEMFPDILEAIIKDINQNGAYELAKTKIIFQTNVADLAHFCAKFYAELLDGVIIAAKEVVLLTNVQKDFDYMISIASTNIDKWRLSKIFVHEELNIDLVYGSFLDRYGLYNEIESINFFKISEAPKLRYDYRFKFDVGFIETSFNTGNIIDIDLQQIITQNHYIDGIDELFGLFYLLRVTMEIELTDRVKGDIISSIIKQSFNINKHKELLDNIVKYINPKKHTLKQFADYNYICMVLGDQMVVQRQYEFLIKYYDNLDKNQVYALISNSLNYHAYYSQSFYPKLSTEKLHLMNQLNQYWKKEIQLPIKQVRMKKRVAIVAGQLLGISHAPTKWAIDYANMLKKYNPELEIKIFVEDWARYSPEELTWLYTYSSGESSSCKKVHRKHLHPEIEVYYANSKLTRTERIQEDVNVISQFKPSIIYKMGSNHNLSVDLLYPYFPIVSHTMGGAEDCNFVDIFTGGYREYDMQLMYYEQNIVNQDYRYHSIGIETPNSTTIKNRSTYQLLDSDFVIITVGNRLKSEITIEFVDKIMESLKSDRDIKWLIVGAEKIPLVNDNYGRYIIEKRIIYIPFEQQLFDLYKICDVYLNPVRQAGGNSAALAMKAKLPIITENPTSDVGYFAGEINCIDLELFAIEILKLKNNTKYYEEKSHAMFTRIENDFSFEKTNEDLTKIFEIAKQKFEKRYGNKKKGLY